MAKKARLLETFGITLGLDLQKHPDMKKPIAALFKGLLELNALANSEDVHIPTWAQQGLEELRKTKDRNFVPEIFPTST